jgi:hypothetical protein
MDIQYAQSAVFTPSDFSFPTNGIKAEATPNTETALIVDVDTDLLKDLHFHGTVKTMTDRRTDLYDVSLKMEHQELDILEEGQSRIGEDKNQPDNNQNGK